MIIFSVFNLWYCETCLTAGKLNKSYSRIYAKNEREKISLFNSKSNNKNVAWDIDKRADCMSFEFVEIAVVMQFTLYFCFHAVPGNVFIQAH